MRCECCGDDHLDVGVVDGQTLCFLCQPCPDCGQQGGACDPYGGPSGDMNICANAERLPCQRRSRRLKELYKRHGHDVVNPMQVGGFFGGSAAGGDQRPKMETAMCNTGTVDVPHFRGQRVA